jgi:hypothetical protein
MILDRHTAWKWLLGAVGAGSAVATGVHFYRTTAASTREAPPTTAATVDPQGKPLLPIGAVVTIKPGTFGTSTAVDARIGPWIIQSVKSAPLPEERSLSIEPNPTGGFYQVQLVGDTGLFHNVAHIYGSEVLTRVS